MTREIQIEWTDGRPTLTLDGDTARPDEPELIGRLIAAGLDGTTVTIGGVPCRIVDRALKPGAIGLTISFTAQPCPPYK